MHRTILRGFAFFLVASLTQNCATTSPDTANEDPTFALNLQSGEKYISPRKPFILYQYFQSGCDECFKAIHSVSKKTIKDKPTSLSYDLVSFDSTKKEGLDNFTNRIEPRVANFDTLVWDPFRSLLLDTSETKVLPFTKLVNESGTILWSKEGPVDESDLASLSTVLKESVDAFNFKTINPSKKRRFSGLDPEVTEEMKLELRETDPKKARKKIKKRDP